MTYLLTYLLKRFYSKGKLIEAKNTYEIAQKGLYTQETLRSIACQFDYVINNIYDKNEPVIDLASGRCVFAEELVLRTKNPIVVTDLSPYILRRNRDYFKAIGRYDRVSLIALDVSSTPFKSK